MMKIKIKKATMDDLEIIQKLNLEVFEACLPYDPYLDINWSFNKHGKKYFKEALTGKNYCCLIAYHNTQPVGYLIGTERNYSYRKNKTAEIDNMGVTKNYRDKGIGTMLIDRFKNWCRARGLTHIRVSTYFDYHQVINFYKKNGMKEMDVDLEGKL